MRLLRIDSSARHRSVTRQMTDDFVPAWRAAHPADEIVARDLATTKLPAINRCLVRYVGRSIVRHPQPAGVSATSDQLIAELVAADLIIIGAPTHNFTVSAELKCMDRSGRSVETSRPAARERINEIHRGACFIHASLDSR
jgi:FMN-dependent NADH-azoreductase